MDKTKIIEILKFLVENGQNIFFICLLVLSWIGFFRFLKSYHWKIYRSLKSKKVVFLKTKKKDFDQEMMVLKNSQIIKVEDHVLDCSSLQSADDLNRKLSSMDKCSLIVVEYSSEFEFYKEIINTAYDRNLPIVIYATENIPRDSLDEKTFKNSKHAYIEICNTSVRLLQAVINLCLAHK
jgi:hypothetical protein